MGRFIKGDTLKVYTKFGYIPFIFGENYISFVCNSHNKLHFEIEIQNHVENEFCNCGSRILLTERYI